MSWSEELLKQVEAAASAAGEAAAEEVWATAIFAANNTSRRLQSNVAIEARTQSEQLMHAVPTIQPQSPRQQPFIHNFESSKPPPPPPLPTPPPPPHTQTPSYGHTRLVSFTDQQTQFQNIQRPISEYYSSILDSHSLPIQHYQTLLIHPLQSKTPNHSKLKSLRFIQKLSDRFN